jgi:HlyD family secretion protein
MKHIQWTALAMLAFVLAMSGCSSSATATPIPIIALDDSSSEFSNVQASAQVVPAQESRLSFVVPGPIKDVTVQNGDSVEAGQILATLNSPDLEYGILQAESAVRAAELEYEYWKLPRGGDRTVERRELAEQNLEISQRTLETAQAELAQTTLVAPFAATVVSVDVQPGEFVQPGQVVIVLATLDSLKIETTDLSELNIAAVEIDQHATVYVEALDEEFLGTVTAISPISDTIGGDVVYTVTIKLDEQPADLLWGMSADVEIQTE